MFLKAALSARLSTRCRTHTLDLTRIKPSLLGGTILPLEWLAVIIEKLPSLQCLIIHNLAAFDYRSLRAFTEFVAPTAATAQRLVPSLRLFTASSVANAVSSSLAGALNSFPALLYLDLSSTRAVNNVSFLEHIGSVNTFPSLEILKLRNIGLSNPRLCRLAMALGTRVWSLDVRRNHLTDAAVAVLLQHCFLPDDHINSESYHDEQMEYMSELGPLDDELSVRRRLAKSAPLRRHQAGITHLYISGNDLSLDSAKLLIKSWRLTALDLGDFKLGDQAKLMTPEIYQEALAAHTFRETLHMQMRAGARLRYLRIHHRFVTGDAILLDMGISAAADAWSFWPSANWNFVNHGVLAYDKDFPGLGLHTLVLAGLPSRSERGWINKTLLAFLAKCSEMEMEVRNDPRAIDAAGHPSSILQQLLLEVPQTSDLDQLDKFVPTWEYMSEADEGFSFFNDEPSRGTPSSSSRHQPLASNNEDIYTGNIADKLRFLKSMTPLGWSGLVAVIRPLGPEERDSLEPSHYTVL